LYPLKVSVFFSQFIHFFKRVIHKAHFHEPPLWLIALVAGLPIFSETMYTPALPHIAKALQVSETWVEYTLSLYFFGTALGTLFWGHFSDYYGRRPALLLGFACYVGGCFLCLKSTHITMLLGARFLQALGGSVGTVLGQAISHDVFRGRRRGQVFSVIGSIISLSTAIGPMVGGFLDQVYGWRMIFLVLMLWGFVLVITLFFKMPETHHIEKRKLPPTWRILKKMLQDPKVLTCGAIIGGANGLIFSFNAEGPFYLINILGLTPLTYGYCFTAFALTGALGNYVSKYLHNTFETSKILKHGIVIMTMGAVMFACITMILWLTGAQKGYYIAFTVISLCIIVFGRGLSMANCLSLGLEDYVKTAGVATSLFVCFYYILISGFTTVMAVLHNGTLLPMPLYFFSLTLMLLIISRFTPPAQSSEEN